MYSARQKSLLMFTSRNRQIWRAFGVRRKAPLKSEKKFFFQHRFANWRDCLPSGRMIVLHRVNYLPSFVRVCIYNVSLWITIAKRRTGCCVAGDLQADWLFRLLKIWSQKATVLNEEWASQRNGCSPFQINWLQIVQNCPVNFNLCEFVYCARHNRTD